MVTGSYGLACRGVTFQIFVLSSSLSVVPPDRAIILSTPEIHCVGIFLILNRSFSFRSFEDLELAPRDCTHATLSWNGTMLRCCFSILLLLGLVVRQGQCQLSLATTFNGPNGDIYADGDKFAILTMNTPISIQRFDIHMANVTKPVAIWTKSGFPFWNDTTSWTKQWEGNVTGQGQGVLTPLPEISAPIQVSANTTLGLYISVKEYNTS